MDIKEKIEELVEKLKGDNNLMESFKKDPVQTLEKLLGVDLPDEKIQALVEGIQAKLSLDKAGDLLGGLKGLFGGKK